MGSEMGEGERPRRLNMGTARRIIPDINGPRTKKVRMGREGGEEPEVGGGGGLRGCASGR